MNKPASNKSIQFTDIILYSAQILVKHKINRLSKGKLSKVLPYSDVH